MNILWITNIQFPAVSKKLGLASAVGGGWMYSLAGELISSGFIHLAVCTTYSGSTLLRFEDPDISYYLLPTRKSNEKYNKALEVYWRLVVEEYKPDLIHIHGTEYAHGLACINACPDIRYVISIQGLISVISQHYYAGISPINLIKHTTLNDIRRRTTAPRIVKKLKRRGVLEIRYIRKCLNIIGRTTWDYSHVLAVNPKVNYYFCNEILRNIFYESAKWSLESKKNHSIFISQAYTPRQGLHQVLKAMLIVREYYPDVTLKVTGTDILRGNKWVHMLSTYGAYIRSFLMKNELHNNVKFLGRLDEVEMVREFRSAHVFICASAIENSPNSLGEAQLIGTPCIASFVGGVPDMIKDGETGLLYRFDDPVLLAFKIIELFRNDDLAKQISEQSQVVATARHDRLKISQRMQEIYKSLLES